MRNSETQSDSNLSGSFPQNIEHLNKYIKTDTISNFNNALSLAIKRDDLDKALKIWKVLNEQEITVCDFHELNYLYFIFNHFD